MNNRLVEKWLQRGLIGAAFIGVVAFLLDLLNIVPGLAGKITPLLLATGLLYLAYDSDQSRRVKMLVRNLSRKLEKTTGKADKRPKKTKGKAAKPVYREIPWHGLILRSYSEEKIAKALDLQGILFLAGAKIRLNTESHRQTREIDFLICHNGHWGILEVDGPHHQHSAEADGWRDQRLRAYGIYVARYPASRCYEQPAVVVSEFLAALNQSTALPIPPAADDPK